MAEACWRGHIATQPKQTTGVTKQSTAARNWCTRWRTKALSAPIASQKTISTTVPRLISAFLCERDARSRSRAEPPDRLLRTELVATFTIYMNAAKRKQQMKGRLPFRFLWPLHRFQSKNALHSARRLSFGRFVCPRSAPTDRATTTPSQSCH